MNHSDDDFLPQHRVRDDLKMIGKVILLIVFCLLMLFVLSLIISSSMSAKFVMMNIHTPIWYQRIDAHDFNQNS